MCPKCQHSFKLSSHLKDHVERVHNSTQLNCSNNIKSLSKKVSKYNGIKESAEEKKIKKISKEREGRQEKDHIEKELTN